MASMLLFAMYVDVIEPDQIAKGFRNLLESVDDLSLDIPDAIDFFAAFLAQAVVDDIPCGIPHKDEKTPGRGLSVEPTRQLLEVHAKIVALLKEYVESGDKAEACHCTKELNMPFSIMHGQEGSGVGYGGESSRSRDLGPTSGDCRQGTHHIQLNGQRLHKAVRSHS
ncbi:unnamed protein product [Sphagnum jensenii]|uniref:MI domain-containing protein n=1 Tax=Sphagnum jensenii TaxID=128206 RepID=A0ABP1BAX1_9BRYO